MSDLAFNVNGEPFEVPPGAVSWRVRKLRPKGAPEVVYGREGTPLMLPVESDMEDLRREARGDGRYRLDALDEHNRYIAGSPAAYVCIHATEPSAPEPTAAAAIRNALPMGPDQSLIEAMRVNSDLARSVIVNFPQMLESAAMLVRAADAAGMPARPPRPFELVQVDEHDHGQEEGPTETPAKTGGVMGFVETLLEKLAPEIVKAVLSGKLQVPGGVGALLDCRRAVPVTDASEPPTMRPPGAGPAPDRRDPAPAASSRPRAPAQPRAGGPAAPLAAPAMPATEAPEGLPTIDQSDLAHFTAILNALTLKERMYAQALTAELSSADLRAWIAELKHLTIGDAVAKIRAVLAMNDGEHGAASGPDATSGGVS
jgi:hypothetical protein